MEPTQNEPIDQPDCNDDPKLTDEEWAYVLAVAEAEGGEN